jgi:hypothetical protein
MVNQTAKDAYVAKIQSIRAARCTGITTAQGDVEDDCTANSDCVGYDNSIARDIGACVAMNAMEEQICIATSNKPLQGTTKTGTERFGPRGLMLLILFALNACLGAQGPCH